MLLLFLSFFFYTLKYLHAKSFPVLANSLQKLLGNILISIFFEPKALFWGGRASPLIGSCQQSTIFNIFFLNAQLRQTSKTKYRMGGHKWVIMTKIEKENLHSLMNINPSPMTTILFKTTQHSTIYLLLQVMFVPGTQTVNDAHQQQIVLLLLLLFLGMRGFTCQHPDTNFSVCKNL